MGKGGLPALALKFNPCDKRRRLVLCFALFRLAPRVRGVAVLRNSFL